MPAPASDPDLVAMLLAELAISNTTVTGTLATALSDAEDTMLMASLLGWPLAYWVTLLRSDLAARLAEVAASRARLVVAGDAERRRVERDLHDGAQQRLVNLVMLVEVMRRQGAAPDLLAQVGGELRAAIDELRELARGSYPALLVEAGRLTLPSRRSRRWTGPVPASGTRS